MFAYTNSKYLAKISGPLLDRIDIHVDVQAVKYQEISSDEVAEPSEKIRERVIAAREIQLKRFKEKNKGLTITINSNVVYKNADMTSKMIREYCKLDNNSQRLLSNAMNTLGLSARAHDKILKVARTIADLDNSENIQMTHIAEAVQFRSLDKKYWGE